MNIFVWGVAILGNLYVILGDHAKECITVGDGKTRTNHGTIYIVIMIVISSVYTLLSL